MRTLGDNIPKRLRRFFSWAIVKGYVEHTPFKRHGVALVHFAKDQSGTRQLEPGQQERRLRHAPPLLDSLYVVR